MNGDHLATGALLVVLGLSGALLVIAAAPAGADHGSPGDWSMEPAEPPQDAQPGYDSASWIHWAQGGDDFRGDGLEEVHHIEMVSEDFSFADCTLFDVEEFGIDRGGNNEGTETDDNLATHVKDYEFAEDRMWMEMYHDDDPGESIHLNATDQFVAHQTNCYTNPDEAGWYQLEGWANGTAWDGDFDEARLFTHYIYVCDCEDRDEAREALGPPPSEETETEEEEPDDTPATDEDAESDDETAADDDDADEADDDTPATDEDAESDDETAADDDDAGEADDDTVADDDEDGETDAEDADVENETDADGPGFGVLAVVLALLAAGLLAARR